MEILINGSHHSQLQLMGLEIFSLFHMHLHFLFISNCARLNQSAVASPDIIE